MFFFEGFKKYFKNKINKIFLIIFIFFFTLVLKADLQSIILEGKVLKITKEYVLIQFITDQKVKFPKDHIIENRFTINDIIHIRFNKENIRIAEK